MGPPVHPAADGPVRKTVTVLFCDLVGSTAFGERVDAESAREAMGHYFDMAQSVIEAHAGTVAKFVGDGLMAVFGVPEVSPDDAERAVRAGLALQENFREIRDHIDDRHGVEVGLRVGINTGEVVIADGDPDIVGDAFNTAARLEAACRPGRVLVGESTFRLARGTIGFADRGTIRAKGKDEPVVAFEVVETQAEVDTDQEPATPFVGREHEVGRLRHVLETTIHDRRAALVSVVGAPGVGKTRLAREMRSSVDGGTRAFELRCERSRTATFAPVAEMLRTVAGVTDSDSVDEMTARVRAVIADLDDVDRIGELLCSLLGAGPVRTTEEMFLAVRRLFEVLGAAQPVVLVVDDVQWAEPLFLDLLEHLAEWVQTVPLLIVCLARPEVRDARPALATTGPLVTEVINLVGLSIEATSELAARLVGTDSLPPELLARIPESTEGNPLFVRELMRMLVDDGVISAASGRWEMMIDVDAVEVPPTINSLLASRVERIPPDERRVLELASVVGSEFQIGAVEAAGGASPEHLEAVCERLLRKELIEPTGLYWGDEPVYRFHHTLIRDAAYRRLLKRSRADLHTVIGDWIERTATGLLGEHEVAVAHHLDQAYRYRRDLDLDDETTLALGTRAGHLFHLAAARALEREDLAAAGSLAQRALECVADDDEHLPELLLLGCEAVLGVGNVADGALLVDQLAAAAGDDPRLQAWVDCFRVQVAVFTDPDGLHDAEQLAQDAAARLEDLGDNAGVAKARIQRASALVRLARVGECETELDLALSAARAVDDRRRVTAVLGNAPIVALWGPSPVPRAGGRCLDVLRLSRITTGSPAVEATSIRCQAVLEALRGRIHTARSMLDTARSSLEELGLTHDLLETEYYAGLVELLGGSPDAAEPLLRTAHEGLRRMGIGADRGQAGAQLARALLLQGRLDEAERLVIESESLAGQNLQTLIASRSVHAEVLSATGRHDEALGLADEAVATAAGSDIVLDHANAVASLARVRAAAGDAAGAAEAAAAANGLYEQKGATFLMTVGAPPGPAGSEVQLGPNGDGRPIEADLAAAGEQPGAPAEPRRDDQPWNRADELTREWANTSDVADLLEDDVDFADRRRLVAEPGEDRAVLSGMQANVSAQHVHRVETIAVRSDLLSVHRMTWRSDDGRDLEWELLTVAEFHQDGHPKSAVVFEAEQLEQALDELHRTHIAALDPAADEVELEMVERVHAGRANLSARDLAALEAGIAEHVVFVDHRPASFGTAHGRERLVEGITGFFALADVDDCLAYVERFHRLGQDAVCFSDCYRITSAQGAEILDRRQVVLCFDEHGLARIEEFPAEQVDEAIARWEELVARADG